MDKVDNKRTFLNKIIKSRNLVLKIFGVILFITAITGIQSVNRTVPMWLYIILGVSFVILLVLYLVTYFTKKDIERK